ncbi:serine/threonine-protein kinase [Arthrobacter sp. H14]|uniref:serine/threonine-protein kinase n=1 Tax=Arthrobacter sp. H14 TaxID=1312959 RepID=UPI0004AFF383|nr:serine/threonine-protein kinase [Arthrobacter sp. H14]
MEQFSDHRPSPEPDADSPGPPVLSGYCRGRKLGTGGCAEVWLVSADRTGGLFAAKVFHPAQRKDAPGEVTAGQARREMQLLDRLGHEHLVRLHDVLESGGTTTLIMDYAAGGSLAALVGTRGQLPVGEVVTILTPIAQCLAYLHGQGITHSDVAPGNVLFTELGKPLLSDLGLGRMTGESGAAPAGTAGFEAPEGEPQWRKESLHPEDDIHGLAAVGWYALTGRVPAAKDRRPPLSILVPGVPEELAAILEAGLEPDAAARPSATEFEQAVYNSADPIPINLVQAVHESVLPHLLTRRVALDKKRESHRLRLPRKEHSRQCRSRLSRRCLRIPLAASALLTAALVAGGLLANSSTEPSSKPDLAEAGISSSVPPSEPPQDRGQASGMPERVEDGLRSASPEDAVPALAWLRSYAFSSGRTGLLQQVNVPDSPAMAADSKIADRLKQTGHVLAGFETSIEQVERISADSTGGNGPSGKDVAKETASMAVTAHTSGFRELDAKGDVVRREKPAGRQQLTLVLQKMDGRWLIAEILEPITVG